MLTIESAFEMINNLDRREAVRKFGPSWAIVVVNSALEIEAVQRFAERPTIDDASALMNQYPGTAYFYTYPGMYASPALLRQKVEACVDAFRIP